MPIKVTQELIESKRIAIAEFLKVPLETLTIEVDVKGEKVQFTTYSEDEEESVDNDGMFEIVYFKPKLNYEMLNKKNVTKKDFKINTGKDKWGNITNRDISFVDFYHALFYMGLKTRYLPYLLSSIAKHFEKGLEKLCVEYDQIDMMKMFINKGEAPRSHSEQNISELFESFMSNKTGLKLDFVNKFIMEKFTESNSRLVASDDKIKKSNDKIKGKVGDIVRGKIDSMARELLDRYDIKANINWHESKEGAMKRKITIEF